MIKSFFKIVASVLLLDGLLFLYLINEKLYALVILMGIFFAVIHYRILIKRFYIEVLDEVGLLPKIMYLKESFLFRIKSDAKSIASKLGIF